jgi:outer membrane protein assembly factor BamA
VAKFIAARLLFICLCVFSHVLFAVPELPVVKTEDVPAGPDPEPPPSDVNNYGLKGMGTEFKKFGEEVAHRIDRIVKKKSFELFGDPWTIQGIPIIFPSANNGFHLGLHTKIDDIAREDPHKVEVQAQVLATDRGRYKHFLQLDFPYAFDDTWRLTGRVAYNRDISFRYYGIGNETKVNKEVLELDQPLYRTTMTAPSANLSFLRYFGRHWRAGPIFGFKWSQVEAPPGSLLGVERPHGISGGRSHYMGVALVYDTLDFEPYPTKGSFNELYFSWYTPYIGSDYKFFRTTYTYRQYYLLHPKLIFAHRTLIENLAGDAPFYEMNVVGGSDNTLGFGGDRFMRGYDGNRFVDKIRTVFGFELRWDPIRFVFAGQDLRIGFVPFIDVGRVWDRIIPFKVGVWHASTGWGTRIIWNRRLIVRTDFAVNPEGTSVFVELGHSF